MLGERIHELHAPPGRLQVDLVPAKGHPRRSDGLASDRLDQVFDPRHRVAVVGVGLVPLEHRELGLMLVRDALVAEILADLVDLFEATDDESLQIELGRDSQVEIDVELVVVGHERLCERAAVTWLEYRGLDLDESTLVEVSTDRRDHAASQDGVCTRLLVHEQVEIALAVAGLRIDEAVIDVRKRFACSRENLDLLDRQRRLSTAGSRREA